MSKNRKRALLVLVTVLVCCLAKPSELKIKAGIIMQSGDIRVIARQDFLLAKTDIVSLWKATKARIMQGQQQIERDVKTQLDYENRITRLNEELSRYKSALSSKTKDSTPMVDDLARALKSHLQKSYAIAPRESETSTFYVWAYGIVVGKISFGSLVEIVNDCEATYNEMINRLKELGRDETWCIQREELRELKPSIFKIQSMTKTERDNITKLNEENNALIKEVETSVLETRLLQKRKAGEDFRLALAKETESILKTSLSGEASTTIKKGQYFLFGITKLIENKILWNLPIKIEKNSQYIELSNDNFYPYTDDELFNELLEAISGVSTVR